MNIVRSRLRLTLIFYISFFAAFGNPLILPLMPSIMESFQVSAVEVTILISAYALPGVFLIPLMGFLEDRIGRKPILITAVILSMIASAGMSQTNSFTVFVLFRCLQGLSITPLEALSHTLIADSYSGTERIRLISKNVSFMFIGIVIYPLLSSAVLWLWDWRAAMIIPILTGLPILFASIWTPMQYTADNFNFRRYSSELREVLFSRPLQWLIGSRMFSAIIYFGAINAYLPILVTEGLGEAPELGGILFSVVTIGLAVGSLSIGFLYRRFSIVSLAMLSSGFLVCGCAAILFCHSSATLVLPMILVGLSYGILSSFFTGQVGSCTKENARASVMAFYSAMYRAAQTVAPPIYGILYSLNALDGVYQSTVVLTLLFSLVLLHSCQLLQKVRKKER